MHGWAIDPVAWRQPVPVNVHMDGVGQGVLSNESRPDGGDV